MFTLERAVVSVAAVLSLGLSAMAQAQSGMPASAPSANGPAPDGMQRAVLFDPAVGVNAYTIAYPAKWHYQAMLWQGSPCDAISAPVFRISSPDGLSVIERMPPFGWSWGSDAASFLSTMQAGTNASMQRAAQVANTQHTIASDYVDYALGQQTYRNPTTGQSAKVAAGSGVTWLSADGTQSYQAPDPNANPNGVLPGAWNRGQQTHGDGSPYP